MIDINVNSQKGVKLMLFPDNAPHVNVEPVRPNDYELNLFWERNFYPDVQMIANDLHAKGLVEAGEYVINIDW